MLIVCAWCKEELGEKAPIENLSETHTIFNRCLAAFENNPEIEPLTEGVNHDASRL